MMAASGNELPVIPDKLYFTISEASQLCNLEPHVLRYWEQEFPQLKPIKRAGNRRFYQHKDLILIRRIKKLLYSDGYTIEGARSYLVRESSSTSAVSEHNLNEILNLTITKLEKLLLEIEK